MEGKLAVMRWHALAGQALAIVLAATYFQLAVPVAPLSALVAVGVASNLVALPLLVTVLLDLVLLTALLALSGGTGNPFVVLYVAQVAVAAMVLAPREARVAAALALAAFVALPLWQTPLAIAEPVFQSGFIVAIFIASAFVFLCMTRFRGIAERQEQLAVLGAFAAEAAHALGSPLSTIAVVANELASEEGALMRDEVERCQAILQRMQHGAGALLGETAQSAPISRVVAQILSEQKSTRVRAEVTADATLHVPQIGLRAALSNLIENALQAGAGEVLLRVTREGAHCSFSVIDHGKGMSRGERRQLGTAFFTTKREQRGMGLGFFLVETFVERVGGTLCVSSKRGRGTTVTLLLPVAARHA